MHRYCNCTLLSIENAMLWRIKLAEEIIIIFYTFTAFDERTHHIRLGALCHVIWCKLFFGHFNVLLPSWCCKALSPLHVKCERGITMICVKRAKRSAFLFFLTHQESLWVCCLPGPKVMDGNNSIKSQRRERLSWRWPGNRISLAKQKRC